MAEILIVDDERSLREGLKALLAGEGHAVRTAKDGVDALAKIAARRPDLVLLDVMMPKANGFRCCEEIRKTDPTVPVVFLTAKDSEADQVRALALGADDFVAKSAAEPVLLARVRRALGRAAAFAAKADAAGAQALRFGSVSVDLRTLQVFADGRPGECLTRTEADLLAFLAAHRGEPFVVDDLITELRGNGFACEDTMLYTHMSNLRRKLGPAGELLVNKRGVGYCLASARQQGGRKNDQ